MEPDETRSPFARRSDPRLPVSDAPPGSAAPAGSAGSAEASPSRGGGVGYARPSAVRAAGVGDRVRIKDGMIAGLEGLPNDFEVLAVNPNGIAVITPRIVHKFELDASRLTVIE